MINSNTLQTQDILYFKDGKLGFANYSNLFNFDIGDGCFIIKINDKEYIFYLGYDDLKKIVSLQNEKGEIIELEFATPSQLIIGEWKSIHNKDNNNPIFSFLKNGDADYLSLLFNKEWRTGVKYTVSTDGIIVEDIAYSFAAKLYFVNNYENLKYASAEFLGRYIRNGSELVKIKKTGPSNLDFLFLKDKKNN